MNIALLLLLAMAGGLYADYVMREFWGRPSEYVSSGDFHLLEAENNNICMSHCYYSLYCILAHFDRGTCYNYDFNTVAAVMKLDPTSDSIVSIKTNATSLDENEMCPELDAIFPVNMTIYDPRYPLMSFEYTMTYDNGEITFVYNVTRLCPPDFTKFIRPKGEYCLYVYASLTTMFTYDQASALCTESYKGVLSGLETDEERVFVAGQGEINNLKDTFGANMFWVSGNRKPNCSTTEQVAQPKCAGIDARNYSFHSNLNVSLFQAFTQTDVYLTTLAGYEWTANNPDGVSANGPIQSCIIMWTEKVPGTLHGKVDDMTCPANQTGYAAVRGFLCGRVPGI